MMSQSQLLPIVISQLLLKMLEAWDYRGMLNIEEKFERKQLRHFSGIRGGLKIPDFSHICAGF